MTDEFLRRVFDNVPPGPLTDPVANLPQGQKLCTFAASLPTRKVVVLSAYQNSWECGTGHSVFALPDEDQGRRLTLLMKLIGGLRA